VQRHGENITERQLDERAMYGKDPVTGTTDDAFRRDASGNPLPHNSGKDATKFVSKDALVKAENYLKNSTEYKNALSAADSSGETFFKLENIKLEDIYGPNYKSYVFGKTRTGTKNNPSRNSSD
jgi:hypothetical protein